MALSSEVIRKAFPSESEYLSALAVRSKAVWGYSDAVMRTFHSELQIPASQIAAGVVYVLSIADTVTGYYALHHKDAETVELQHLFVDPQHIKRGYGSQLLQHAIAKSRADGYQRLIIESDPNAAGFYEKHRIPVVRQIPSSVPGRSIPWLELQL